MPAARGGLLKVSLCWTCDYLARLGEKLGCSKGGMDTKVDALGSGKKSLHEKR